MLIASACSGSTQSTAAPIGPPPPATTTSEPIILPEVSPLVGLDTELVADGLSEPVALTSSKTLDTILVVERTGTIARIDDRKATTVLDITDRVGWDVNEQGFLGLALHPGFPDDPRAFIVYTNLDLDLVVSSIVWDGTVFDPDSEQEILVVPQPHKWHQGGGILFGPQNYLWLTFGDGGGTGDQFHNGQNPMTLNATISRIDIDAASPYAIPPTNPFATGGKGDPAVWAYGLRNPWRITIDGDQMIIADVGQAEVEEIDIVPIDEGGGYNFGWPIMEGDECFDADTCDTAGLTPPVLVIGRAGTCAVIGGPVYRGTVIPELYGQYLYGDYCTGWIRSAPLGKGTLVPAIDWSDDIGGIGQITSLGTDPDGEILITTLDGAVHRIVAIR